MNGAGAREALRKAPALLPAAALLLGACAAVRSIPFYRGWIVTTYVVLCLLLGAAVWRGARLGVPCHLAGGAAVAGAGVLGYLVPSFTYLQGGAADAVRATLLAGGVLSGVVLAVAPPRLRVAALAPAVVAFAVGAACVVRLDPAPHIDVWYTLQGSADAVLHGRDMYTQVWPDSPGLRDAFTYLPWTAVLLAPAKLLTGDVRWGLAAAQLAGAAVVLTLARRQGRAGTGPDGDPARDVGVAAAALLLLLPGTLTQVEQAWTEPLIFLLVAGALLALDRGRPWAAVALLALALASKQHIVLLLPLLAVWRPVGPRRTAVVAGAGALLVLPWFAWDPAAMWHDTVTLLVGFHPIQFADTLYLAAIHELSWTPPFWLTGALVAGVVGFAVAAVRRHQPSPAWFAAVAAVALFGANLLNKQAFYNQFWLVGALVLLAWPADPPAPPARGQARAAALTGRSTPPAEAVPSAASPATRAGPN